MLKLRQPNETRLSNSRLARFMMRVRESLRERGRSNLTDLRRELAKQFVTFFNRSGEPELTLEEFEIRENDLPNTREWNLMMEALETDLRTAFDEITQLNQLAVAVHNYGQVVAGQLREKAAQAASKVIDVRLQSGQLESQLIIAGDDFNDLSKVDQSFSLQNPAADIITDQGVCTLSRVEASNVIDPSDVVIEVKPLNIQNQVDSDGRTQATPDGTRRFYEGNFFDYLGKSRPEGGKFHLEERVQPGMVRSGEGITKTLDLESPDLFNQVGDLRRGDENSEDVLTNPPLSPGDIIVIDRGASEEEKRLVRQKMMDGNPDTFWECEFVIKDETLERLARGQPVNDVDTVFTTRQENPDDAPAAISPVLSGTANLEIEPEPLQDRATPAQLRAAAADESVDRFDLEVEIVIRLPRPAEINFLTLNPYNFDETAWLEVFEVSTSEDESSAFELIEGFDQNQFQNTLTNEANEELRADEAKSVLSPDRYAYRGQGVWTFPVRTVSRIRFKVRQKTPVPNPYQRLVVQLRRQLTRTISR